LELCAVFFSLANFSILVTKKKWRCESVFFIWRDFAKFRPEKYDFALYKGFFIEKMTQIRQISKEKNKTRKNRQIFMISSSR
jgi:hypothetical protein